jgi:hypothetical protein
MAAIQDTANAVAAGGDVAGAQQRLIPIMAQIAQDKQLSSGSDSSAETDTPR